MSGVAVLGVGLEGEEIDLTRFGMTPREAETLHPRHRRFLACAWAAFEGAGREPEETWGVFAGLDGEEGGEHLGVQPALAAGRFQSMLGHDADYIAARVSYRFGLTGPSLTVSPGGAAPLAAVHLACESLLAGEIDAALAGGGDDREMGVLALARLDEALTCGRLVRAVIRGSAVNHDGRRPGGGRARVVAAAGGDPAELATSEGMAGLIRVLEGRQGQQRHQGQKVYVPGVPVVPAVPGVPCLLAVRASSAGGANACIVVEP